MTVDTEQFATTESPSPDRMRRKNRILTITVIVLAAGLITVGGWLISELASGSTEGQQAGFPTGTFVVGAYSVEYNEDGTCRWYANSGALEMPCKYGVNGDLYTEMWFDWPDYTTAQLFPATYYWTFDGENLTFELWGHDANASRRSTYSQVFVKSE